MTVWPVGIFVVMSLAASQAQPQPRPLERKGTAAIRGRVITADSGNPVRQAVVTLMAVMPRTSSSLDGRLPTFNRNVNTDSHGNFEFTGLPAATYRLYAKPNGYPPVYLAMAFGGTKPMASGWVDVGLVPGSAQSGTTIRLGDDESFDRAIIALPRGGAITGRVIDEHGEPMSRVQVSAVFFRAAGVRGESGRSNAQTDDFGRFRLFGLAPGDYAVAAQIQRRPRVPLEDAPPEPEGDRTDYLTTYSPSTTDEATARRVRVREAAETPGIEIRMVRGRLYTIGGTVTDSRGRPIARAIGSLNKVPAGGLSAAFGLSTDPHGRFEIRDVPPGAYHLVVHQQIEEVVDGYVKSGGPGEMASVPLSVDADLDAMVIVTGRGATITGQIVFEHGAPPPPANGQPLRIQVTARSVDPRNAVGIPTPEPALVGPDLSFTMGGLRGRNVLGTSGRGPYLKSITAGGTDITDTPHEFKDGERVTIVLTDRASTLEGDVTGADGWSAGTTVILFSEEKGSWRMDSSRTRRAQTDRTGHYRIPMLMPGRYYVAALVPERLQARAPDAAFFEELAKEATIVVIGEQEKRQVDLVIR